MMMTMMANDNFNNYTKTIPTEERIMINVKYLVWLYAKSKERKKQNNDVFDAERALELVIRDAGGEKAVKELFLKEQDEKIIDDLKKLNPVIAERFGQHREPGLQALKELIPNLGITNDTEGVIS
jgi:hypothetical protein